MKTLKTREEINQVKINLSAPKWFWKFQDEISKKIEGLGFTRCGYCNYQEHTKNFYCENWTLRKGDEPNADNYLITAHRESGFIFMYKYAY